MGETSRRNGKITRFNGDVYEGGLFVTGKEESMDGKGKLIKANGEIYEGNFYMDTMHASGCYYYTDGSFFVGKWQWGKRQKGVMIHADGTAEEWKYRNGELVSQKPLPADDPEVIKAMKKKKAPTASASKPVSKPKSVADSKTEKAKTETAAAPAMKKTTTKSGASTGKKRTVKTIKYENGGVYEGEVRNGLPDGKGKYTFSYGDVYEGDFCAGTKTGQGKYISTDGWYYEGGFADGDFDGYGVYHYTNGDVYEGEWWEDKRQGKGKYTFADGSYYTGEWKDDKNISASETVRPSTKETKATESKKPAEKKSAAPAAPKTEYKRIEMSSGDVYEGGYANGEYHGQGTYTSHKGWVYEGEWNNGVMTDGKLTFTASGSTYEGHFVNGCLHGHGKEQVFKNGKLQFTYEGEWQNGKRYGKGVMLWPDSTRYEGDWVENKREGYGKYDTYTDKYFNKLLIERTYEGQWHDDEKHGQGTEKHYFHGITGHTDVEEGQWVNGKKEGRFVWQTTYSDGHTGKKYLYWYENGKSLIYLAPYDENAQTYEQILRLNEQKKAEDARMLEERKRKEATSAVSTAQETTDADEEFWEKFDDPEKLREKWENPNLFLDSRDALIINSSEYFGQFYSLIDQCCKESDFEAANEILGALVGLTAQELFDYYNVTCMRVYGKIKQLVPSYASASLIDNAIDAAISHTRSISIAGVINIAFYLYKEIGRSDALENALQIYAPAGSKMSNTDADGMASLWFRRYIVNDGDVEKNIFGVNPDHTPYELWGSDLDNALSSGNTMLANGYIGPNPTIRDDDEGSYEDSYSEDYSDQYVENDYIKYSDGSYYSGRTLNGKPHGYGEIRYSNQDYYMGWWANGQRNGIGQYGKYESEKTYYGLYKDGSRYGMGIEFYKGDPYDYKSAEYGRWNGMHCYDRYSYTLDYNMLIKGNIKGSYAEILFANEAGESAMYVGELWHRTYNGIGTYYTSDGYKFKCRWIENEVVEFLEVRDTADNLVYDKVSFKYYTIPK